MAPGINAGLRLATGGRAQTLGSWIYDLFNPPHAPNVYQEEEDEECAAQGVRDLSDLPEDNDKAIKLYCRDTGAGLAQAQQIIRLLAAKG